MNAKRETVENVHFSAQIRNALNAVGFKSIGEIREASNKALLSL
jgi:hypothetical protein